MAAASLAERPRFGVLGGAPLTEFFVPGLEVIGFRSASAVTYRPATKRVTFGPSVDLRVWRSWRAETGFLYKRVNYDIALRSGILPRTEFVGNTAANSWEIPLLARRPFSMGRWESSAGGGGALRVLGQFRQRLNETSTDFFGNVTSRRTETSTVQVFRKRVYPGVTAAFGVLARTGRIRIGPEVRYTRWLANADSSGFPPLQFRGNQVEVLLSVRF